MVILAGVATVAGWRTHEDQERHRTLESTAATATALERAQAQLRREQASLSALIWSGRSALVDDYRDAAAGVEDYLSLAQAAALAEGETDDVLTLADLAWRISELNRGVELAIPFLVGTDRETASYVASTVMSEVWPRVDTITLDLEQMVYQQEERLAAKTAAANSSAETTLWLVIGLSIGAFAVAVGTVAMLVVSVVQPLAALRASARAIASGDSEARAKVSGPEEVASLARDFNQMTDALSAKTEEYIATTNLTGDIIVKFDKDGRFTFLNDAACHFFGRAREELLGTDSSVFVHPDDMELTVRTIQEARVRKGPTKGFVNRLLTPMGTRMVEWNGWPLFDSDGHYAGIQITGRDITERKQAEAALRESEERFRQVAGASREWIWEVDLEGRHTYSSPAVRDILGYEPEEVLGKYFFDYYLARDKKELVRQAREIRDNKEVFFRGVIRKVHKDGHKVVVETTGLPIFDAKGNLVGYRGVDQDITERMQAEEALRESEARYRLLADNTSDLIWTMDLSLKYTYVSPSIVRMRGYTPEEVVGVTVAETLTPASLEVARKVLAEELALETMPEKDPKRSRKLELEMYRKDGSTIWTEVNMTFIRDADGNPIGIQGVTRDISERKKAEEELKTKDTAIASSINAIALADLNGDLSYVNPAFLRMWGYEDGSEVLGRPAIKFWKVEEEALEVVEALRNRGSWIGELAAVRKDGSTFYVQLSANMVTDEGGKPICMIASFVDISERKRMEEERERLYAELEVKAISDSLTGLYNHAHFYQRLAEEIERSKRYGRGFAIVMMDVDNFKHYNDTRGHQAGDEALCLVADCIRAAIRRSDIAFRYGGDEFAAILLHADSAKAQAIAKRIKRCLGRRLKESDEPTAAWLGLSIGMACFPEHATAPQELVRIADAALYDAKRVTCARHAVEWGQAVQSLAAPPQAADEKQSRALCERADSLAAALRELSAPDEVADSDLLAVAAVAAAAEIKDPCIRGHQDRVSRWAAALAEEMGFSPERVREIRLGSLLHDIGKITVSENILIKPGKLTAEEFACIKDHPIVGATLVSQVRGLERLAPMIRHHHERLDGEGYPDGLVGGDIPLEARILAVVDVFDALTHERCYRGALSTAEAIAELERRAGSRFDPAVVKAFVALARRPGGRLLAATGAACGDREPAAETTAGSLAAAFDP
ncbi:MAG: PAS domain S-box protein [Dehalococcoidia bacterium]